jgi:deoxyribodipyrimidine photo-lyase
MSLFIFRRDLRIVDNLGFIDACKTSKKFGEPVYPIFILNPEQIDSHKNPYFSNNSVQFMCESLEDLNKQLDGKLSLYYGDNAIVLNALFKTEQIKRVFFNLDHTGYSQKRDKMITDLADKYNIECITHDDVGIFPVDTVKTTTGLLYSKFTPYYERIRTLRVPVPITAIPKCHFGQIRLTKYLYAISHLNHFYKINPHILVHGGRKEAVSILKRLTTTVKHYNKTHDYPIHPTTHLSAYLKYGCVSAREAYYAMKKIGASASQPLIRQLFWREFYLGISKQHPEIMNGKSLRPSYENIKWEGTSTNLKKWKEGMTGFPIVDASMREMNTTGYMHNRLRLITSAFLIKTLLRNWRDGEKYFAQTLVDYDFSNNNGGWQWSSGSGTDSQPYFRIFNPWMQSSNFDPDAEYIKKWIPELADVPAKDIHQWNMTFQNYRSIKYPKPIVDYHDQKEKALRMYNAAFKY